jgi:hypothetical protein
MRLMEITMQTHCNLNRRPSEEWAGSHEVLVTGINISKLALS